MKMTNEQADRLSKAQNSPANSMIDIMTFTAFLETNEELEKYITRYEKRAAEYQPKKKRKAA